MRCPVVLQLIINNHQRLLDFYYRSSRSKLHDHNHHHELVDTKQLDVVFTAARCISHIDCHRLRYTHSSRLHATTTQLTHRRQSITHAMLRKMHAKLCCVGCADCVWAVQTAML